MSKINPIGVTINKQQRYESQRFMPSLFKINQLNLSVGAKWRQMETKMLQQFLKSASMITWNSYIKWAKKQRHYISEYK